MADATLATPKPLQFKVASHIVEDLGLNLYTSFPRVLVEFIANAYDADSKHVDVKLDFDGIKAARDKIKETYSGQRAAAVKHGRLIELESLARRTLPDDVVITIEDAGCGMSREDLEKKFLIAGRRRRREEPHLKGRTEGGRPLMGRKGLGKLAGFGVGKKVVIVTRKKGEAHATKITLTYDALSEAATSGDIAIPEEVIADGGGLPAGGGTKVEISQLLYDPTDTDLAAISAELGEHFELIDPDEFSLLLNAVEVERHLRKHDFAWPEPKKPTNEWIEHKWQSEDGRELSFKYRLRFTGREEALPGSRRGVRVYAHNRLAAAPSLLKADTNMHGFRMTDYLDGAVHADFVDDELMDYIATDRQSLRWESPLLAPMCTFLSEEIRIACAECQKDREEKSPPEVRADKFTKTEITQYQFSKRDEKVAYRIAAALNSACKQGVKDKTYKEKLPVLIQSIGHGNVMAAISNLAAEKNPSLTKVAIEVGRLRQVEIDQLVTNARGRVQAIGALTKIVMSVDFREGNDEKTVQKLLERCPWIVDLRFNAYITANQRMDTLIKRLTKELKVGGEAPKKADTKERPDLVFLVGNEAAGRIVIIELKAPNLMLDSEDLDQLMSYMRQTREWLKAKGQTQVKVTGELIGSLAPPKNTGKKILALADRIEQRSTDAPWRVRDFLELLTDTQDAHRELIEAYADEADED